MMNEARLLRYSIADVERDTGVSKELLRQWERRYGYPQPGRDEHGDRSYTPDDVATLKLLRQLIDHGGRPRKLVGLPLPELEAEWVKLAVPPPENAAASGAEPLLAHLRGSDAEAVRAYLRLQLQRQGLAGFLLQAMAPISIAVGEAWARGELAVHQEHLYTEAIKVVLREEIGRLPATRQAPRVMLTTIPGEAHSLGLLMVEGLLRLNGCECVSFGVEMPFEEILRASERYGVDILVLSFSANCTPTDASIALLGLRQALAASVTIWAGGAGLRGVQLPVPGLQIFDRLDAIAPAVAEWRTRA
ncbi:MerR family transcriptional regulator [Chitinilyticum litopenaei]|uniref:MerR family transcriptional regulator n=2 Tax=Chitinilyticum piscinae TaxID=2866724 RepID=A0A8J7FK10_9NEIS|nr:MerR family transcriptional regulator [Chitinilyticum piscinae]